MTDIARLREFAQNRIEVLRARDLEIPEFHAMQLPLADLLATLLDALESSQQRADALHRELAHLVRLMEPLEREGGLNIPGLATLNGARAALAAQQVEHAPDRT